MSYKEESFYQRYKVSPEGLVLWLDQSDGRSYGDVGNWYDMSGEGNHGVQATGANQPAITGALGLVGSCRDFDGWDFLSLPAGSASLEDLHFADFSVSAWISDDRTVGTTWGTIIATYAAGDGWLFRTFSDGAGDRYLSMQIFLTGDNAFYKSSAGTISLSTWHHVCCVYNSTAKTCILYIDGTVPTYQTTTPGTLNPITDSGNAKSIGRLETAGGTQYFNGRIPSTQIFSRALLPAEVQRLYLADVGRHGGL